MGRVLTDVFQKKQYPKLIVLSAGRNYGGYASFGDVAPGVTVIYIEICTIEGMKNVKIDQQIQTMLYYFEGTTFRSL